jgi:hypothetical protein
LIITAFLYMLLGIAVLSSLDTTISLSQVNVTIGRFPNDGRLTYPFHDISLKDRRVDHPIPSRCRLKQKNKGGRSLPPYFRAPNRPRRYDKQSFELG